MSAALSQFLPAKLWRRVVPSARPPVPELVEATLTIAEAEPPAKRQKTDEELPTTRLLDLPEELLLAITEELEAQDLAFVDISCRRLRFGKKLERKWRSLYEADFNGAAKDPSATSVQQRAAWFAGSWKELYRCRLEKNREARKAAGPGELPWEQPCHYELIVAIEGLLESAPIGGRGLGTSIVFLLDGSGSVTEDDFKTMTSFIGDALATISVTHPLARVGILQFSNDVRIEMQPQVVNKEVFDRKLEAMTRMNGGTNISLAICKAGQLLKADDTELLAQRAEEGLSSPDLQSSRVVVLLTDGRVDAYQAHEAVNMMERLADEQANVSLHAFGVGRGVDKTELLRIIAACGKEAPERYTGLRVLDEAPW